MGRGARRPAGAATLRGADGLESKAAGQLELGDQVQLPDGDVLEVVDLQPTAINGNPLGGVAVWLEGDDAPSSVPVEQELVVFPREDSSASLTDNQDRSSRRVSDSVNELLQTTNLWQKDSAQVQVTSHKQPDGYWGASIESAALSEDDLREAVSEVEEEIGMRASAAGLVPILESWPDSGSGSGARVVFVPNEE